MVDTSRLDLSFQQRYGKKPRIFRAPGRVNLIGEHTDYNDGFVLPIAIDRGTFVAIAGRPDLALKVWSQNFDETIELNLGRLGTGRRGTWMDYIEGTASALIGQGLSLNGADVALISDVSIGGGLSSSAALEVALASALVSISGASIGKLALALAGQKAEHEHVGIHSGLMDQFTSVHAVKEHAILLDCRSVNAKHIPLKLHQHQVVICDSHVRHALASSEYNCRRQECELGVQLLRKVFPALHALRDIRLPEFEAYGDHLPDPVKRRCRHVISENERTLNAAAALADGDLDTVGMLMSASHRSLRDDYEVSCAELDLLVESSLAQPGVLGSRMTGGGFGGCTVNLVERSRVPAFCENVSAAYSAATGITPDIFGVEPAQGAQEITF
jgi:galactokinase